MAIDQRGAGLAAGYRRPRRIERLQLPEYRALMGVSVGEGERGLERVTSATGQPLLNLTYADTHRFPPPPWALDALERAARGAGPSYTPYRGDAEVRGAVAGSVSRFLGVEIDPDREIVLTPGTQAALFTALMAVVDVDEHVVLPDPDYISSERLVRFAGGRVDRVVLGHAQTSAVLDVEALEAAITDATRCVLFSNPNNPTGAVYQRDTVEALAELARRRNLFVIADELYSRLVYDGGDFVHIAALEGMKERTITLLGPSKTESMSGFRLGLACAPPEVAAAMEDVLGATVLRAPAYAQWALVPWLRDDHEFVAQRVRDYQELRDMTVDAFATLDCATLHVPGGTAYAFPSVASIGLTDQEIATALVEEAGVIVNPGYQFGQRGLGSFRICFAQETRAWADALSRICDVLGRF